MAINVRCCHVVMVKRQVGEHNSPCLEMLSTITELPPRVISSFLWSGGETRLPNYKQGNLIRQGCNHFFLSERALNILYVYSKINLSGKVNHFWTFFLENVQFLIEHLLLL